MRHWAPSHGAEAQRSEHKYVPTEGGGAPTPPTPAHLYRTAMGMPMRCGRAEAVGGWAGGRVGGGEAAWGAWGQPTVAPHHCVRTERTAFHPTPGGSVSLWGGTAPSTSGRGPARLGCGLDQFSPQRADIRAGRQGPTWLPGGVANRLIGPGRRLPPFATYLEGT